MCAIIDTCAFAHVFNEEAEGFKEFRSIREWLMKGGGKAVYGGTKYATELTGRNAGMLAQLERRGKTVRLDKAAVDKIAKALKKERPERDFDDEHLVAIVIVSGCRVVCTKDKRAHPYLKMDALYPKPAKKPKIFDSSKTAKLCCDKNMAPVCR